MSTFENIFLHTGGLPVEQAAERLTDALGARITRKDDKVYLARPMVGEPNGRVGGEVYANFYQTDTGDPAEASLIDDYDVVFAVWCNQRAEELQLMEAQKVFNEIIVKLRWPAVLVHNQDILVSAWSPALGRRDFPTGTTPDTDHKHLWADFSNPVIETD